MAAGQLHATSLFFFISFSSLPGPHTFRPRLSTLRFSQKRLIVASSGGNGNRNGRDPKQQKESVDPLSPSSSFSLKRISGQVLIIIGTLGFLDAGYSGDWSRIGVISPEIESILQLAAYGVVPLSLFLVWLISKSSNQEPR